MAKNGGKMNRIALINILSTVLLNGISMFTAPIFSRMLGTENYGITSTYLTWVSVFNVCLSLQTGTTLNNAKTRYQKDEKQYQSSIVALSLLSFLVGALGILLFRKTVSSLLTMNTAMLLLMLVQAYGLFCVNLLNGKNTIEFQAERNLFLSLGVSLSTVVLSILLIGKFPKDINYWGRILALTVAYGGFGIGITFYFFRRGKTYYSKEFWAFCIPLSVPLIFHALANLILGQSDRVMLQRMLSSEAVGIYSLAASFSGVMTAIWGALNNSWSPFFYEFARNNQVDKIKKHCRNYLEVYSVLSIGFMLLAPEVFSVFADKAFWSGTKFIPLLVMGHYFVFLYSFPVNYEFFHCRTKPIAACTMAAGLCNIVLNLVFISGLGAFGAALATMIAHGIQFLIHHVIAKRMQCAMEYPFRMDLLMPYILVTSAVCIWLVFVPGSWWIRWGLGAVLGIFELARMAKRKSIF